MRAASIQLNQVGKRYGGQRIIAGLDLTIKAQEFVVLLGPSGCGKSTLLRMLAGLEEISSGEMLIDGQRCNEVPARHRDFAMVFQNYALYPHLDVAANMSLALRIQKVPKAEIERKVREVAGQLGLSELLQRKPKELSGGQRQRVAMGRAIVREPRAFLFDEPLSNLDAELRLKMRTEIKRLHQRLQATMVYVTHDQTEAMTLADRLVIMRGGKVQQVGAPVEVFDKPCNLFVAGFVGSPPMNLISGDLAGQLLLSGEQTRGFYGSLQNRPFVLGIRPQHLLPVSRGAMRPDLTLVTEVKIIEPLGTEMLVYVTWQGQELMYQGRFDATLQLGQRLELGLGREHLHLFSAGSGERLDLA